jgi:hypothetical protein
MTMICGAFHSVRVERHFRFIRTLQQVPKERESEVASLAGFKRLQQVTESPIFGPPFHGLFLLSVGQDALSVALKKTFPEWTVENLTEAAYSSAAESSDFSLVALAALSRDAVVLAALRESVVLYAMAVAGCMPSDPEYVWEVDEIIQQRAARFVDTFNDLFGERLPRPVPENAKKFWTASGEWKVIGRCVRVGFDDRVRPIRHYHWAIDNDAKYRPVVRDFWDSEIWTTARYRAEREAKKRRRP